MIILVCRTMSKQPFFMVLDQSAGHNNSHHFVLVKTTQLRFARLDAIIEEFLHLD